MPRGRPKKKVVDEAGVETEVETSEGLKDTSGRFGGEGRIEAQRYEG